MCTPWRNKGGAAQRPESSPQHTADPRSAALWQCYGNVLWQIYFEMPNFNCNPDWFLWHHPLKFGRATHQHVLYMSSSIWKRINIISCFFFSQSVSWAAAATVRLRNKRLTRPIAGTRSICSSERVVPLTKTPLLCTTYETPSGRRRAWHCPRKGLGSAWLHGTPLPFTQRLNRGNGLGASWTHEERSVTGVQGLSIQPRSKSSLLFF